MVALLLLSSGCTRIEREDPLPVEEESEGINFAPQIASTKALLDEDKLQKAGTKIQVYDYLSDFSGKINGTTISPTQTILYFSNEITFDSETQTWPYCSPATSYPWTKSGNHTFFGWLVKDKDGQQFVGDNNESLSYNSETRVLTIPVTTMKADPAKQFDFSYASPLTINAANRSGTSVPLNLQHFFSALKMTVKNTSGNTIVLKSVTIKYLKNSRGAEIDFKVTPPTIDDTGGMYLSEDIVFECPTVGEDWGYPIPSADVVVNDLIMNDFILMWPHEYDELSEATINVKYKVRTTTEINGQTITNDSEELEASVDLSSQNFFQTGSKGMDAGKKYVFMLQFKKSTIDIRVRVLPWEYEEYDWDYSDHSISARSGMFKDGVLAFYRYNSQTDEYDVEPTTDEWSAKTMRFKTRNEVMKGRFYVEAPISGTWQVTPYPMSVAQYFVIEPSSGNIDANTNNGMAEFTVSVNPTVSPTSTQTLFFSVAIQLNGEWVDANSEFNRKNIRLVLDAN